MAQSTPRLRRLKAHEYPARSKKEGVLEADRPTSDQRLAATAPRAVGAARRGLLSELKLCPPPKGEEGFFATLRLTAGKENAAPRRMRHTKRDLSSLREPFRSLGMATQSKSSRWCVKARELQSFPRWQASDDGAKQRRNSNTTCARATISRFRHIKEILWHGSLQCRIH